MRNLDLIHQKVKKMIVLLAGQKGGAGKSTLAINIASYLKKTNNSLLIIDADRQGTIINSEFTKKFNVVSHFNDLEKRIKTYKKTYKNIVIDVEGRDSEEARSSLLLADIAVIPFIPSQADLLNLKTINSITSEAKRLNRKLKCFAVINNANTHAKNKDAKEAINFIKTNSKLKITNSILKTRNSYRDIFAYSKSIFELKDKKAKVETSNLIQELKLNG